MNHIIKQCLGFIAIVLPIGAAYAYFLINAAPVEIDLAKFSKENAYDCGNFAFRDIWTTGANAIQDLAEQSGYSFSEHYQTGIKPEAFNPEAEYAYYELKNLLPRWFLKKFPKKVGVSLGHLEENSAYVSFYCMPPKMKYASFAVYNLIRWQSDVKLIGAEMSRPINRYNLNSTDDGLVVMVTSADHNTYDMIRSSFMKVGVPASAFNFYAINPKLVNFYDPKSGFLKSRPDILNFVFRRSIPDDLDDMDRYRKAKFPTWHLSPPETQSKNPVDLPIINRPFEDKMYRAGGNGFENVKESSSELHLQSKFEEFEKAVIKYVESKTGMKFKDADTMTPVSHMAHKCILDDTFTIFKDQSIFDLYGTLASCARITDDCAVVHTRPTPGLRDRGFAYKNGTLFALIASDRKNLNPVYSSQMITQGVPSLQNPHLTYENKENLVSWRDTALKGSSSLVGTGFDDFVVVFSGAQCPEDIENCKSPKISYSDGGSVAVERIYVNKDTLYGPKWDKILPSRLLMFQ